MQDCAATLTSQKTASTLRRPQLRPAAVPEPLAHHDAERSGHVAAWHFAAGDVRDREQPAAQRTRSFLMCECMHVPRASSAYRAGGSARERPHSPRSCGHSPPPARDHRSGADEGFQSRAQRLVDRRVVCQLFLSTHATVRMCEALWVLPPPVRHRARTPCRHAQFSACMRCHGGSSAPFTAISTALGAQGQAGLPAGHSQPQP